MASHLEGQTVAVLGGTGKVGSGVVYALIDAGAIVIVVSRSKDKFEALKATLEAQLTKKENVANLHLALGSFTVESEAEATKNEIVKVLAGKPLNHVITTMAPGGSAFSQPGPTQAPLSSLKGVLDESFYNEIVAAKVLTPLLAGRDGTTYTITSGGLAHYVPHTSVWMGTVRNAALNAFVLSLAADLAEQKIKVNGYCIHFGIGDIGLPNPHPLGMPQIDSREAAPLFLALLRGKVHGQVICADTAEAAKQKAEAL